MTMWGPHSSCPAWPVGFLLRPIVSGLTRVALGTRAPQRPYLPPGVRWRRGGVRLFFRPVCVTSLLSDHNRGWGGGYCYAMLVLGDLMIRSAYNRDLEKYARSRAGGGSVLPKVTLRARVRGWSDTRRGETIAAGKSRSSPLGVRSLRSRRANKEKRHRRLDRRARLSSKVRCCGIELWSRGSGAPFTPEPGGFVGLRFGYDCPKTPVSAGWAGPRQSSEGSGSDHAGVDACTDHGADGALVTVMTFMT
ncbi:hypothetical protein GOBAR_AA09896 [Gossypium barbadense]|uniref:Uncharacterized protein n=1 Tax=Gossypium barbadense TaxID=3634 RepID=A0A2P5Y572_GOSBA|nr:hypothetical protein GOBAR_AA09896 [Gossypium barbadense]